MQIDIRPSNLALQPEHRDRIGRRAAFALSRLAGRIRRVEVRLADLNGPRGGIDKRCRVLLHLHRGDPLLVEERGAEIGDLIDRAMGRLRRALDKRFGVIRELRHGGRARLLAAPE